MVSMKKSAPAATMNPTEMQRMRKPTKYDPPVALWRRKKIFP